MLPIRGKRVLLISVAATASFAWLVAAAIPNSVAVAPRSDRIPDPRTRQVGWMATIEPLHDWAPLGMAPIRSTRNPFAFKTAAPREREPRRAATVDEALTVAQPAPPLFRFEGLAEDLSSGSLIRTAIISGAGQLFLVKEGEMVTPRYRVAAIGAGQVDSTDISDDTRLRLTLK